MSKSMAMYLELSERDTLRELFFDLEYTLSTEVELDTASGYLADTVFQWALVLFEKGYIDREELETSQRIVAEARKQIEEFV